MKKFKLFALAIMAMLSINTFAQVKSTDTFTYTVAGTNATITGFVNGLDVDAMATVSIPATIVGEGETVYDVVAIDYNGSATKFNGNSSIKKVVIQENDKFTTITGKAFEGCANLTEIDLSKVKNLTTIGANAFAGTGLVTLDLSKTKVRVINEFCDAAAVAPNTAWQQNATLTSVVLCDTWTSIGANAFKNCTALKSVNFQTANPAWIEFDVTAAQAITGGAFVGTVIEDIDLSGTLVKSIPAETFKAADVDNTALKTVKLNATITALNANFARCTNLTSIDIENDAALQTLVASEFAYDAKLSSINLKNVTSLAVGGSQFQSTGLTSVIIVAGIPSIPTKAFQDCDKLETVTFKHADDGTFTGIGTMAFAGCKKLETITIPACLTDAVGSIAAKAFFMCTGIKTVTYKPAAALTKAVFDADAFLDSNDNTDANKIVITKNDNLTPATTPAPTCTKYAEAGAEENPTIANLIWEKAEYKSSAGKYYVKVKTPGAKFIKVKAASGTKAYEAYLDATAGTMYMMPYMVNKGYYYIGNAGATTTQQALIITDNADIAYEDATGETGVASTSTLTKATVANAMVILDASKSYTDIMAGAAAGQVIYGWANSATKGTGWLNITSGTLPAKSLYVLAKPSAGARLNVVWLDEDGNVDEEITAIYNVKAAKAENGAIYNLAGQKVNASYKGVVIKDGKKYIQK